MDSIQWNLQRTLWDFTLCMYQHAQTDSKSNLWEDIWNQLWPKRADAEEVAGCFVERDGRAGWVETVRYSW